jgi:hypothetical protein
LLLNITTTLNILSDSPHKHCQKMAVEKKMLIQKTFMSLINAEITSAPTNCSDFPISTCKKINVHFPAVSQCFYQVYIIYLHITKNTFGFSADYTFTKIMTFGYYIRNLIVLRFSCDLHKFCKMTGILGFGQTSTSLFTLLVISFYFSYINGSNISKSVFCNM